MRKPKIIIIVIVVIIAVLGVVIWQRKHNHQVDLETQEQEKKAPAINGVEVTEDIAKRRPIAVMIENHTEARPQSGLSDADIVYEALAEGGITRFMALFQTHEPTSIGPVRSARPYYLTLADEWGAVYAHSGGSPTALQELRVGLHKTITDADEFFNGSYYKRANDRNAPHNLYTSGNLMRKFIEDKKVSSWTAPSIFQFVPIATDQLQTTVTEITIPFSTASYLVKYKFDPATNTYKRQNGTVAAIDRNNQLVVSPKNVVVMFVEGSVIPGDMTLAMQFRLDRSGPAYLFTGGKLAAANWKGQDGKIVYTDNAGKPLVLQPGPTWIEIIPKDQQNNVSWK